MQLRDLFESKWWDDTDMIRLYHGTSSALLPVIKEHGLQPPTKALDEYALDVLEEYIPRGQWTDELQKEVVERCARVNYGRKGDQGQVIYCMADIKGPAGYAISLAQHGGEIARDVYDSACNHLMKLTHPDLMDIPYSEYRKLERPIQPRFAKAHPIVIEILVPKSWCMFYLDLHKTKDGVLRARAEGKQWAQGNVGDVLDEIFDNKEVRIGQTVPKSKIQKVHAVTPEMAKGGPVAF